MAELQGGPRVIVLGQNLDVTKPDDRYGKGGGRLPKSFLAQGVMFKDRRCRELSGSSGQQAALHTCMDCEVWPSHDLVSLQQ